MIFIVTMVSTDNPFSLVLILVLDTTLNITEPLVDVNVSYLLEMKL